MRHEQDCNAHHMPPIVQSLPVLGHAPRHLRLRRQASKLRDVGGALPLLAGAVG